MCAIYGQSGDDLPRQTVYSATMYQTSFSIALTAKPDMARADVLHNVLTQSAHAYQYHQPNIQVL